MNKAQWRALRNHLSFLACTVNVYSKEYQNLNKRIKWINEHRLTWVAEARTGEVVPF
jgi:hypothetical protein